MEFLVLADHPIDIRAMCPHLDTQGVMHGADASQGGVIEMQGRMFHGQPFQRLGRTFTYCAKKPGKKRVVVKVRLSRGGKVLAVRTR